MCYNGRTATLRGAARVAHCYCRRPSGVSDKGGSDTSFRCYSSSRHWCLLEIAGGSGRTELKGPTMGDINRVWNRMKASAERRARGGRSLSVREAKLEVAKLCQSERTEQPPDNALEYLAGELVRLTLEGRARLPAPGVDSQKSAAVPKREKQRLLL